MSVEPKDLIMRKMFDYVKNKSIYFLESIKNRFPCRLVKIQHLIEMDKKIIITYQAATKLNIRKTNIRDLMEDNLLIEKFHPTDCIKLGFLAASEILLKESRSFEEAKENYKKAASSMFQDIAEEDDNVNKQQ